MLTTAAFESAYQKLNPSQKKAVNTINGPVMVLAGPGTGKTEVLAVRIGNILQQTDTNPSNILCLTFSNAGVNSMNKRLGELLGKNTAETIEVSTFHSFAHGIITKLVKDYSVRRELITSSQRYMILEDILNHKQLSKSYFESKPLTSKRVGSLGKLFELLKKECVTAEEIKEYATRCIKDILPFEDGYLTKRNELNAEGKKLAIKIEKFADAIPLMYEAYQKKLDENGKFEFQDMLSEAIHVLNNDESILLGLQEQYQYILIDEFQDTNPIQLALVQLLIKSVQSPNIFIVGDDDQTIYRFQGANQKNFDWIANMLPELQTILLDTNYRSTATILDRSFHLINRNNNRHPLKTNSLTAGNQELITWNHQHPEIKSYENNEQEAFVIAQSIADLVRDLKPKETVGVITRKNADLEPIAKWLEHFEVPFQLNSKESNLLDITFGKAMYSALVCLNNLDKDKSIASAYFSNLLLECGYTNQLAYASLLYKKEKSKLFFIEWLQLKTEDEKILFVQDWLNKLLAFQLFKTVEIDDTVIKRLTQFIDNITNTKSIADVFVAWETFVANFLKSDKYKTLNSLADLLTYYQNMDLSIDYDKKQKSITPVILSTIHASKGLEYDVVFLMGCEAGNWESKGKINEAINVPKLLNNFINSDSDDEEDLRRVVYVGMTRAKKFLNISYNRFSKSGKPQEITKLIKPLLENQMLNEVLIEAQDLPDINQEVYQVNTDQGLMDLINEKLSNFHISSSSINNFLDCQNRFFFQNICKIEGLPNVAASFGSLVHKILEIVSKEKQLPVLESKIQQVAERIFPSFQYNFHPLHREKCKQYSIQVVTNYLNDFPIISAPLHIEKYLTTTMPSGVKLNGFIDRIGQTSGNLSIIDYKTSKYPEVFKPFVNDEESGTSFWRQAMIYYYLVRNNFNDVESSDFYFHYVVLNKKIQFERQENLAFEDWLQGIWNQIHSLEYLKSCSNKDCNYCKGKLIN